MDEDEKELRRRLGEKLGVEFCSEEELAAEIDIAKRSIADELATARVDSEPESDPDLVPISINTIFERLRELHERINRGNRNKQKKQLARTKRDAATVRLAANALHQVVTRLGEAESRLGEAEAKLAELTSNTGTVQ